MTVKSIKNILREYYSSLKDFIINLKGNRDMLVFVMFILLSTGLWFLNALRKDFVTTIEYPVKYHEFPDDFILLGEPQHTVQLKISSVGYNILPYHFGKILSPENLNVSGFKRMQHGDNYGAYVLTRDLKKSFARNLTNGIELLEIYPDTLFVNFEKKVRKKVPVRFQSKLTFEPQYQQSGEIIIKPDSVMVSGAFSLVDTISYVLTQKKEFEDLSDSLVRNVALVNLDKVVCEPGRVVVNVPVEPFTEKVLNIPLSNINVPDSLRLKCFPSDVKVSFTVAVSRFNNITDGDFKAVVDYNSGASGSLPDRLKVKLTKIPEGIKNLDYAPLFIECLFEKVNQK